MSLDYILPNGATIGFSSEAERDAYLGSTAGTGAQTQEFALAANPGESMETIKNIYHARHYGPGGAFEQQLLSGAADPTQARAYFDAGGQDPAVIQKILSAAQTWGAQTDQNFGYNRGIDDDVNPGLNQALSMIYGYGGDYGQGGWVEHAGQMNAEDRASADRFLRLVDDADVGAGGGGAGGGGGGDDGSLRWAVARAVLAVCPVRAATSSTRTPTRPWAGIYLQPGRASARPQASHPCAPCGGAASPPISI
jgi:hypothetical protein